MATEGAGSVRGRAKAVGARIARCFNPLTLTLGPANSAKADAEVPCHVHQQFSGDSIAGMEIGKGPWIGRVAAFRGQNIDRHHSQSWVVSFHCSGAKRSGVGPPRRPSQSATCAVRRGQACLDVVSVDEESPTATRPQRPHAPTRCHQIPSLATTKVRPVVLPPSLLGSVSESRAVLPLAPALHPSASTPAGHQRPDWAAREAAPPAARKQSRIAAGLSHRWLLSEGPHRCCSGQGLSQAGGLSRNKK